MEKYLLFCFLTILELQGNLSHTGDRAVLRDVSIFMVEYNV